MERVFDRNPADPAGRQRYALPAKAGRTAPPQPIQRLVHPRGPHPAGRRWRRTRPATLQANSPSRRIRPSRNGPRHRHRPGVFRPDNGPGNAGADIAGHVYSADIIAHHQPRHWHSEKQPPNEPLAGIQIPRAEIWSRWFPDEAQRVTPITAPSSEVLTHWQNGNIDLAFLDGSHTYASVRKELSLLDTLIRGGGGNYSPRRLPPRRKHRPHPFPPAEFQRLRPIQSPAANKPTSPNPRRKQRIRNCPSKIPRHPPSHPRVSTPRQWPLDPRHSANAPARRLPRQRLFPSSAYRG